MQHDLQPERAAIERRSSPGTVAAGWAAGVRGSGPRWPAATANRPRSTVVEPVSEMDLKLTSAEENVDEMDAVITENYRSSST